MRKMKKFLAVALSAAMVLSVSVPAMAANASNTETALNMSAWKTAEETLNSKQEAYDEAELALKTAKEALAKLKKAKESKIKVTDKELREADDAAKNAVANLEAARLAVVNATAAYVKAEGLVEDTKTALDNASSTYDTLKKAYDKNSKDTGYDPVQLAKDKQDLDDALDAKTRANTAYQNALAAAAEAEKYVQGYQGNVDEILDNTAATVAIRDFVQALLNAKGDYDAAIKEKQAEVEAAQAARDAALKELNEAKEAERAARAKIDSARQKVAQANYDKAVIAEQQAAKVEENALAALNDAKAELVEIQKRIEGYLADIDNFAAACDAYDEAIDDVQNASADLVLAEAKLATADYLLEVAENDAENVPNIIEKFEDALADALTDEDYQVSPEISDYVKARQAVKDAKNDLRIMQSQYPQDVNAVLDNAWAFYCTCEDEVERAKEAYQDALDNVAKTSKAMDDAFDKQQKAIKALYVTKDSNEDYVYTNGQTADIFKPVATVNENILLDRYEDRWVELETVQKDVIVGVADDGTLEIQQLNVTQPKEENGQIKFYKPEKLDTEYNEADDKTNSAYRVAPNVERIAAGVYVYADGNRDAITNKEEPAQVINVTVNDERYIDYETGDKVGEYYIEVPGATETVAGSGNYEYTPSFISLKGVSNRWLNLGIGDTMRIPTRDAMVAVAPYAQEIIAKAKVDAYQEAYDLAVVLHNVAKADLEDAIADYEFCFGHKPGEQNQATKQIVAGFKDVTEDDWFAPYVADVVDKGIMKGYASTNFTTFGSYDTLQRQDFVMTLWNMAGQPVVNTTTNFKDVEKGSYYEAAVNWAYSEGIVKGYNETEFGVGKNITREDFTVMLYRFNKYTGKKASIEGFTDASKVSGYAVDAVKWAVAAGAISGKTAADGSKYIDPQAPIARCESAKILSILTDK